MASAQPQPGGMTTPLADSPSQPLHPPTPRRWAVLFCFCLLTAINAVMWISFAPIVDDTRAYYSISSTQVDTLSVVFLAAYIPSTVLAVICFHSLGFRNGLIIGALLNAIGGWVRYASTDTDHHPRGGHDSSVAFPILMVGQLFPAVAQPFFTNLPAMLSAQWFPMSERDIAVVIASMFNVVGLAVGQILPTVIVSSTGGMPLLLLSQAIFATVSTLVCFVALKDKPPHPPSLSTARHDHSAHLSTRQALREIGNDIRTCLGERHYLVVLFSFGSGLGLFNALATLLAQFVKPCGYSNDDAGVFGLALIVAGLVSSGAVGVFLDSTHRYRESLKVCFALASVAFLVLVFLLRPNNFTWLVVAFGLAGACMMPLLPISLESAVECTYPVSEDVSGGMLIAAGQITGAVFIYSLTPMIDLNPHYHTVFVPYSLSLAGVVVVLALVAQLFNGEYKRLKADLSSRSLSQILPDEA